MKQPLVSIIIPAWNPKPDVLEKVLHSIEAQTYRRIEVIIVDDGSVCSIQNIECKIPIRIIQQEHAGAPAARNRGLKESTGEYVLFWDADIIGEPHMIETLVTTLEKNPTYSFAYCNFYFGWKKMPGQSFDLSILQSHNYIHSTSLVRKKDAIQWDESLKRFQDWDYFLTLAHQGKQGIWVDEYLFRAITGGTMSSWLPSFAYKKPWCYLPWIKERVNKYQQMKQVVTQKHHIK